MVPAIHTGNTWFGIFSMLFLPGMIDLELGLLLFGGMCIVSLLLLLVDPLVSALLSFVMLTLLVCVGSVFIVLCCVCGRSGFRFSCSLVSLSFV